MLDRDNYTNEMFIREDHNAFYFYKTMNAGIAQHGPPPPN